MKVQTICSMYCKKDHRLVDGVPVDHACFVLPVAMLELERQGEFTNAVKELTAWIDLGIKRHEHVGLSSMTEDDINKSALVALPDESCEPTLRGSELSLSSC
jgi:hypothetical protein